MRRLSEYDGKEHKEGLEIKISGGSIDDPYKKVQIVLVQNKVKEELVEMITELQELYSEYYNLEMGEHRALDLCKHYLDNGFDEPFVKPTEAEIREQKIADNESKWEKYK